jgi:tetratricopeptide (TPR) repeat protein
MEEGTMIASRRVSVALTGAILCLTSLTAFAQTEDAAKILAQAKGGTLALVIYGADKAETAKGSAMALAEDILATAYHVVSQAYDVEVLTAKGKKVKVEGIIGIDRAHDVALLKLKAKVPPLNVSVAGHEALAAGARLFALGSNSQGQVVVSEGTLRRMVSIGPQENVMEVSLTTEEQFSGGPLLDIGSQVVGMMIILDRNVRVALPVEVLQKVSRTGKVAGFKSWAREDYFSLFEGASFAGRIAAGMDELMTARIHLEKAVKLDPSFTEGYRLLAYVYDKQRDYAAAIEAYRLVTTREGARADAFYGLAGVLKRTQKYQEAAEAYEKAISMNFEKKEIFFELGDTYEAMQNWAKAAEAYEKYLALKPEVTWNGYLRLGSCRVMLKQYDAAIAAFVEAQKAQPRDLKVNTSLADAYEKAGQLEKAEETYNSLAVINPADAKAYYSMAIRMYDAAGKYDKAISPARKIVDLDPKNELNIYNVGLMYFKLQRFDEAIAAFRQSLAIKPDLANAWFQVGSAQFQLKRYKEAADAYKKYTELAPGESSGWLGLAVSYMYLKNFEAALEPIKKCVDLKPENAAAQFNLAIVYINLKDYLSAREIYKKLTTLDPALAEKLRKYIR